MNECMNEWTNEKLPVWIEMKRKGLKWTEMNWCGMNEWMNTWLKWNAMNDVNDWMNKWHECKDKWNEWMTEWLNGWQNEWMHEWVHEWEWNHE